MADRKQIVAISKQGHSLSQISELTGLTTDEVKDTLGEATGLPSKRVGSIFEMTQRGLSLEMINLETGVALEVLKQFLPEVTVETHLLADSTPPRITEEAKVPSQRPKTLPNPQYSHTPFLYYCEYDTSKVHKCNLLTGKQTSYEVRYWPFKEGCRWSELPGGSLLITGGGFSAVKDALKIEPLREWAVSSLPPMHTARGSHAVVYHSQYLYVLGGSREWELGECERYVCAESRWEVLPPLPVAGTGMSAVVLENSLYALGGWNDRSGCLNTVRQLSLDSLTWKLMQLKLPQAASNFSCFKTDAQVYLVIERTLYSFTPLEVKPIKKVEKSIGCYSSRYSRGTLYYEKGKSIWSLAVGKLTSP
jgi:hypothetical protein